MLQSNGIAFVRQDTYHSVTIYITHSTSEGQVFDSLITLIILTRKKHHCLAELEGMLDVLVSSAEHLYHQLVEGVVITLTHLQGIPCITPFDLPFYACLFSLFAECLLLCLILQLEQQTLLL